MYLVLKTDADAETIKVLGKSLIIVAVFSSLAAIVQFFINPGFLRVVAGRPAFGGHLRSQGVFNAEFLHSYYLIAALAFTALWVKSARIKWALIGLFLIGIALSFHRMSWIVACVLFLVYLALERRESSLKVIVLGGTLAFLLYFLGTEVFPIMDAVESSTVVRSRVADDTMTGRMRQYAMVLERFDDIAVWGAGSWGSDAYYSGMISIGLREWASGQRGGIHNLYLALLFIYGLPAALLFCIALASIHIYIWRAYSRRGTIALFPLLFLVMYWIMNLTNSFPLTSEFGVFVGIVLGSSAAVLRTPLFAETANGISV
jgi:O-antigen ligase